MILNFKKKEDRFGGISTKYMSEKQFRRAIDKRFNADCTPVGLADKLGVKDVFNQHEKVRSNLTIDEAVECRYMLRKMIDALEKAYKAFKDQAHELDYDNMSQDELDNFFSMSNFSKLYHSAYDNSDVDNEHEEYGNSSEAIQSMEFYRDLLNFEKTGALGFVFITVTRYSQNMNGYYIEK